MVFLGVTTYGCESWTIKKVEHRRIDAFELWCSRRLLRVPSTARSNQSILREINPEYSLEGLMLKLKLHYFGHLMRTAESLKKALMLRKIEGRGEEGVRGWDSWWHHWSSRHELGQTLGDGGGQRGLACSSSWDWKESDMTGRLNNSNNPTTVAPIHAFFLPRPFQGSKKFRVFIMAKTETEHRRRKRELRKRLLQKEPRELPARGLQMGFPQIVLMHQGQQATGATEGRARTTGRSRLSSTKWPQWPWENSQLPLQGHQIPC